jgi:hypothetical protein
MDEDVRPKSPLIPKKASKKPGRASTARGNAWKHSGSWIRGHSVVSRMEDHVNRKEIWRMASKKTRAVFEPSEGNIAIRTVNQNKN